MRFLKLSFISPTERFVEHVRYVSLEDLAGKFGVYPGHDRFMTMLNRSVGYYVDSKGTKLFVAHDYGVFRVEHDEAFVLTRIFIKGTSVEDLEKRLMEKLKRVSKYDKLIRENLKNLEKFLLKRMAEVERFF